MVHTFRGYLRRDGSAGTRNHIGIISSVICSSVVTNEIANKVSGSVPIVHANGCAQLGDDFQVTKNMLTGVAENPNFYGALLIGLGCETNQVTGLLEVIPKTKPIEGFGIQQMAGGRNTVERGVSIASTWSKEADEEERKELPVSLLKVGIVTEDIDEESLKTVIPVVSDFLNLLIKNGVTVVFGLTNSLEPAGDVLAVNTNNSELKKRLTHLGEALSRRRWEEAKEYNRKGFSEEDRKIAKLEAQLLGENEIQSLLNYNEKPEGIGLHLIKVSGSIVETLSNFASVGCNISIVISKRGILTSSNILPCITVAPNSEHKSSNEFLDCGITAGQIEQQVVSLFSELLSVSSGKLTELEEYELGEFAIPHIGTTF
ncbi:UxaA family hydrolase [Peribacillus aracenensis]|uniref:UxaA family hydrolase n=1 Tax=Peribacillus aracenensis TaxID=2976708 RepID=UPI0021A4078D|nr:UxaA family hydrolase [Peribacillus sp. BBB004]